METWQRRGFNSRMEYEEDLAKRKGFDSLSEYRDYKAKKRGFKSATDYTSKKRRAKELKLKLQKQEEKEKIKEKLFWDNVELRQKNACNILKEHHKTTKDDPESLTTEFLQEQIGILCNKPRKTIKK